MSEEQLKELQEYNLEYLEAQASEEMFGGDFTSAVELKQANKEIERLNNIINELEKWLKYKKEQMEEFELYKRKETGAFWYSTMGNIETFIERIQELKGSDKK